MFDLLNHYWLNQLFWVTEITVPWEHNRKYGQEIKLWSEDFMISKKPCKTWECICTWFPVEMGCYGFVARFMISYLDGIVHKQKITKNRILPKSWKKQIRHCCGFGRNTWKEGIGWKLRNSHPQWMFEQDSWFAY